VTIEVRDAAPADAPPIARIYNEGIEDRVATLKTRLRSAEERAQWLAERPSRSPVVVAVDRSEVVGWASVNRFNARAAYDLVADVSVYVARERRGRGIGAALLSALEARARSLEYHKLALTAFPHNAPGRRLYERCGFREVGIYREQGQVDGKWMDTLLMEKLLT
jgi:L-amino acid N-acyltransferase YncA